MADLLTLDLSNNNVNPNFYKIKKWRGPNGERVVGIHFKVSEGATFRDPVFADWSRRARKQGLRVGGYHFAQPGGGDALAEARWFAHLLGPIQKRDLKPVLDLEANPGKLSWAELEDWTRKFNQEVKRLTGVTPMLYASKAWVERMPLERPLGNGLWLAYWSKNGLPFPTPVIPPWKRPAALHQFTSEASFPSPLHPAGMPGRVDISKVNRLKNVVAFPKLITKIIGSVLRSQ
jgi:GH25 family lysozyme M1 (1,4-beta-N-acetylmuramidase)